MIATSLALIVAFAVAIPATLLFRSTSEVGSSTSLLRADQADGALAAGESATQRTPWWPEPWHLTARAAQALEDLDREHAAASPALDADPRDRTGLLLLAEIEQRQDGPQLALVRPEQLRELDPNGVDLHLNVLECALVTGDESLEVEARAVIEAAISPADEELWQRYQQVG